MKFRAMTFERSPEHDELQDNTFYVTPFIQIWRDNKRHCNAAIHVGWLLWYVSFWFDTKDEHGKYHDYP